MAQRRLGRGLDFLLTTEAEAEPEADSVVDLSKITANPWQPRTEFDEEALEQLTESIRRHGVVQPILVRRAGGGAYELVAGERRFLAAQRAGLTSIPATVRDISDEDMLSIAIIENVQRRDLNPVERARAFQRLADEQGLTHQQIAEATGLSRSSVTNSIRLLELDAEVLTAVTEGALSEGHARALLGEKDPDRRRELFESATMSDEKMSVRTVEEEVKKSTSKNSKASTEARNLEKTMTEHTGLKVQIRERGQAGRIVVHYRNLEDFDRVHRLLTGDAPDV